MKIKFTGSILSLLPMNLAAITNNKCRYIKFTLTAFIVHIMNFAKKGSFTPTLVINTTNGSHTTNIKEQIPKTALVIPTIRGSFSPNTFLKRHAFYLLSPIAFELNSINRHGFEIAQILLMHIKEFSCLFSGHSKCFQSNHRHLSDCHNFHYM